MQADAVGARRAWRDVVIAVGVQVVLLVGQIFHIQLQFVVCADGIEQGRIHPGIAGQYHRVAGGSKHVRAAYQANAGGQRLREVIAVHSDRVFFGTMPMMAPFSAVAEAVASNFAS